jgi:hypothetical protein
VREEKQQKQTASSNVSLLDIYLKLDTNYQLLQILNFTIMNFPHPVCFKVDYYHSRVYALTFK